MNNRGFIWRFYGGEIEEATFAMAIEPHSSLFPRGLMATHDSSDKKGGRE
jgi:hypothetical protein